MQGNLFGEPEPRKRPAHEIVPVATARAEGDRHAQACADKAERGGWDSDGAEEFILDYLNKHGPTSGEILVDEARQLFTPHDDRAFGVLFARLARKRLIVKSGMAMRRKGHGTSGAIVWSIQ